MKTLYLLTVLFIAHSGIFDVCVDAHGGHSGHGAQRPTDDSVSNGAKQSHDFTGKVIVITDGTDIVGASIAKLFSILGAHVVIAGANEAKLREVGSEVEQLSPKGLNPLKVTADLSKAEDIGRLVNKTIETYGQLDILVNNPSENVDALIKDRDFMQKYDKSYNHNIRGLVLMVQLSVGHLEKANGTIINISSMAGLLSSFPGLFHTISKSIMNMMTRVLALELGPKIRVNTITPGVLENKGTERIQHVFYKNLDVMKKMAPLKRLGLPLDVAKSAAFLASSDAQFVSGTNLIVDGGLYLNFPADARLVFH